jgi:hypothetical protein
MRFDVPWLMFRVTVIDVERGLAVYSVTALDFSDEHVALVYSLPLDCWVAGAYNETDWMARQLVRQLTMEQVPVLFDEYQVDIKKE